MTNLIAYGLSQENTSSVYLQTPSKSHRLTSEHRYLLPRLHGEVVIDYLIIFADQVKLGDSECEK